jgi:hypothetical protein
MREEGAEMLQVLIAGVTWPTSKCARTHTTPTYLANSLPRYFRGPMGSGVRGPAGAGGGRVAQDRGNGQSR